MRERDESGKSIRIRKHKKRINKKAENLENDNSSTAHTISIFSRVIKTSNKKPERFYAIKYLIYFSLYILVLYPYIYKCTFKARYLLPFANKSIVESLITKKLTLHHPSTSVSNISNSSFSVIDNSSLEAACRNRNGFRKLKPHILAIR